MKLGPDWFVRYPVDFEFQKWTLLAFLRDVRHDFDNRVLYPHLSEIKYHLSNLEKWSVTREFYIKKELKGLDFERMTLIYDTPEDSSEMSELNDIVDYSILKFRKMFGIGREIWREVEGQMKWHVVGIIPNYKDEGFIMLKVGKEVIVYRYDIKPVIVEDINIGLTEIIREDWGLGVYESLKLKLIKETDLPLPLTIAIESNEYPIDSALIPIVQSLAVSKIKML
jgi:hypothetical protein